MTRNEIKAVIRTVATRVWTPERLEDAMTCIDHWPNGTTVLFEDRFQGIPQGPVFGEEWEAAARVSGRITRIGTITD